jgi:hypothetical protein
MTPERRKQMKAKIVLIPQYKVHTMTEPSLPSAESELTQRSNPNTRGLPIVLSHDCDISFDSNFSQFMLVEMLGEVRRLVDKYSADPWTDDTNANCLVLLLSEHIPLLQTEIDDLIGGRRTLSTKDIFGPGERDALMGKVTNK